MASLLNSIIALGPRRAARIARLRLTRAVMERDPWYESSDASEDAAILVGGCGRSGTTLVTEILNRHPRIACGPETTFFCDPPNPGRLSVMWNIDRGEIERMIAQSPSVVRFAETFFRRFAEGEGKARWADKTPRNVRVIPRLLSWFPRGRFIHVVRDGRDVACSLRHHPRTTIKHGKVVPASNNNPIGACARRWLEDTSLGLVFRGHPRCFELRYESIVGDPEPTLRALCDFLGEDFDPAMLDESRPDDKVEGRLMNNPEAGRRVHGSSVGRWRRDLSPGEAEDFDRIAGELLIALGYAEGHGWVGEAGGER